MSRPHRRHPKQSSTQRRLNLALAIELEQSVAMVACSNCANSGELCYFSKELSTKCSCCLKKNVDCDGSFSLEEFRKVFEQKKRLRLKSRAKRREINRLREKRVLAYGALIEAQQAVLSLDQEISSFEESDEKFNEDLSKLEDKSRGMLRREMMALGVLEDQPEDEEVALADPNVWPEPSDVDWSSLLDSVGGISSQVPG